MGIEAKNHCSGDVNERVVDKGHFLLAPIEKVIILKKKKTGWVARILPVFTLFSLWLLFSEGSTNDQVTSVVFLVFVESNVIIYCNNIHGLFGQTGTSYCM